MRVKCLAAISLFRSCFRGLVGDFSFADEFFRLFSLRFASSFQLVSQSSLSLSRSHFLRSSLPGDLLSLLLFFLRCMYICSSLGSSLL